MYIYSFMELVDGIGGHKYFLKEYTAINPSNYDRKKVRIKKQAQGAHLS